MACSSLTKSAPLYIADLSGTFQLSSKEGSCGVYVI